MGDPKGMHTFDCPAYQATITAWEATRPPPMPPPRPLSAVELALRAGYRRGWADCLAALGHPAGKKAPRRFTDSPRYG